MNWNQLISAKRWGYEHREQNEHFDARSEFQRDYDRLIFSSPFRRLQNKTQVFPLPGVVFVHNRLTHSLEVASVGRSLGRLVYNLLKKKHPNIDQEAPFLQEVGNIISAACLSHDLGNPAFGHSGEAAISTFFTDGKGLKYQEMVSKEQWADLTHFEGNANALRILTHAFNGKDPKGFALTYTSLASIVKYPCSAIDGHVKGSHHRKKYGFFDSEKGGFEQIARELGIAKDPHNPKGYMRHPLVYLVEAADDICYNIIDLEDAHHLKILSYKEVEDLLLPLCAGEDLRARLDSLADTASKVSLLRAKAINTLINGCAQLFVDREADFLEGTFDKALMDALSPEIVAHMKLISDISVQRIYNAPTVVQIEIAGFKVMNALLEEFVPAYLKTNKSMFDKKVVAMMPEQFHSERDDTYSKIRAVLDYVSGMTDVYAVDLYRKIKGISIASLD
ncbi:deoxyguanosinetriphosphate triphosphohydrolase [Sphingobacterium sp. DK4209]|uniref:Deoxyguanosinetriphosphate triphosphohydrolase n=1 Tax=Sphingobacterium zhuxiongii TaxID=2662364 RepID=A0A5Q0Q770_9SPHI|nr:MULTISPECIES: deoxyguanosinetriphosphate triphosphohydrolase [unclassified Sphingobacterium]MVZ64975.1 deoxyguanosinetriphosphate triphosphohydrolase [Sphingobacterium sp. DK4209]QGA25313.1 deoxyguanosinetriphosphate triphosphohydrolase [Sphingobacterium sp. dk4302]